MSHACHKLAANYSPAQILHDSCETCAERGEDVATAINEMDDETFARAWDRAEGKATGAVRDVSEAESALLDALWAVHWRLGSAGVLREKAVVAS